ncbi:MAG TPA: hypothetical protein VF174_02115 [Micromonosporaceae bacterium]
MTDQTTDPTTGGTRGVALLIADGPTGLTAVHTRVPAADVPALRHRVAEIRAAAALLPADERTPVIAVFGRPGMNPRSYGFDAPADRLEELRALVLEAGR